MCTILLTFADKLLDIFLAPSPRRPYWEAPQTPPLRYRVCGYLLASKKSVVFTTVKNSSSVYLFGKKCAKSCWYLLLIETLFWRQVPNRTPSIAPFALSHLNISIPPVFGGLEQTASGVDEGRMSAWLEPRISPFHHAPVYRMLRAAPLQHHIASSGFNRVHECNRLTDRQTTLWQNLPQCRLIMLQ